MSGEHAVWINGRLSSRGAPHLSAFDRGLTLSDGLFETMRVSGGQILRLDEHLARLAHGLKVLDISSPPNLRDWVLQSLETNGDGEAGIRLVVTRGIGVSGVSPPPDAAPTVIVTCFTVAFPETIYNVGLTAHVASGRRNERSMTLGLKTLAYTDAVAGMIEARRAGADEVLFLDTGDHCSEAASSNLFAWNGETLVTPPISCGALPGITRAIVLELAASLGLPAFERILTLSDLVSAQEAFLTSSLRGIAPLVRVDHDTIGSGVPGALTRRLTAAYTALVAAECRPRKGGLR